MIQNIFTTEVNRLVIERVNHRIQKDSEISPTDIGIGSTSTPKNSLRDFVFLIQSGSGLLGEIEECDMINQSSISSFLGDTGGNIFSNAKIMERA